METSLLVGPNTTFSNDISLNAVVCVLNSTAPLNGSPAGFKPKEEQVKHLSILFPYMWTVTTGLGEWQL